MGSNETIYNRIKTGGATSVVISAEKSSRDFLCSFLQEYKEKILAQNILPVWISSEEYNDALSFWRTISSMAYNIIQDNANDEIKDIHSDIEQDTETDDIKDDLVYMLKEIDDSLHKRIMFILGDFEKAIKLQKEPDMMKLRNLTDYAIIMTISHKPLDELGKKKYNNAYFSNKFDTLYYEH